MDKYIYGSLIGVALSMTLFGKDPFPFPKADRIKTSDSWVLRDSFEKFFKEAFQDDRFKNSISVNHACEWVAPKHMDERIEGLPHFLSFIAQVSSMQSENLLRGKMFDIIGSEIGPIELFTKLFSRESELAATHSVFYHAHAGRFRVLHDLYGSLARFLNDEDSSASLSSEDFVYVRDQVEFSARNGDLKEAKPMNAALLWNFKSADEQLDNTSFKNSKDRLSANISLFANLVSLGESSLEYFLQNRSEQECFTELINEFLIRYDFNITSLRSGDYGPLKEIVHLVESNGCLLQIFIPRDKVDQCTYVSLPGGKPACELEGTCKKYSELVPSLALNGPEFYQIRIILDAETTLNPHSGIKIFRNTTMPRDVERNYERMFKGFIDTLFASWLERMKKHEIKQETLEGIYHTKLGQKILKRDSKNQRLLPQIKYINRVLAKLST